MNNINELFALPIALEPIILFGDIPLYGSKNLNDKFIQAINNSKRGKLFNKTIEKLIDEEKIIPCFADNGLLKYFKRRIFKNTSGGLLRILKLDSSNSNHPLDYVLALYDYESDRIIILISNHITEKFSVKASDEFITLSLTHEMIHMFAHQNPNKFLSLFKDELNSFYLKYFKTVFKLNDDKTLKNDIEKIYRYLFLKCEMTLTISLSNIFAQLSRLQKYSSLNKEEFKKLSHDYINIVKSLITGKVLNFINMPDDEYKCLISPLDDCYKEIFGKVPDKGLGQELVFPSEVISGYSDIKIDSKIKKALQSM